MPLQDVVTQGVEKSILTEQGDLIYASAPYTVAALHPGTSGQVLTTTGSGGVPTWTTVTTEVPGNDTEVIYNQAGQWGANPNLTFNYSTGDVTVGQRLIVSAPNILPDNPVAIGGDVDSYLQVNLENLNGGPDATADFIITADDGTDSWYYGDFGYTGSGYTGATFGWDIFEPHDMYLYTDGGPDDSEIIPEFGGNLVIGTMTPTKSIKFFVANTAHEGHPADIVATMSSGGVYVPVGCEYHVGTTPVPHAEDLTRVELENIECHGTGLVSGGKITPTGGISFMIDPYVGYVSDGTSTIIRVSSEVSIVGLETLYDGLNTVCIGADNQVHLFNTPLDSTNYVLLGVIFTAGLNTIIAELVNTPEYTGQISQRVTNFVSKAVHALVEEGCGLSEGATSGSLVAYSGTININLETYTLNETSTFYKMFYCTDYAWAVDFTSGNIVTPSLYNDMSEPYLTALKPVTPTYWTKSLVYRSPGGRMYMVYGQHEYETEDLAKAAPIPTLPENIEVICVFLGTIVAQAEDVSIGARINDVRPYLPRIFGYGSSTAGVSLSHLSLTDIGTYTHAAIDTFINTAPVFETSTGNIKMDGSVSVGILETMPRADHIHPSDTSREPVISKNTAFNKDFETTSGNIQMNGTANVGILETTPRADHVHPVDTSREAAFAKNTAFNQDFETTSGNIKMNGTVNVGALSTIARADHIHPVDTSREPIISKNTAFNQNFETTSGNIKMNGAVSVGALSTIARADHIHDSDTSRLIATRGNWKSFYSDGSGVFTDLALGGKGTVLCSSSASTAPTFRAVGSNAWPVASIPDMASAAQSLSVAANVLTGTLFQVPTGSIVVGSRIIWEVNLIKTAAGVATWAMQVKFGTAGTTGDAAIATWTSGINTAAIDQANIRIICDVLTTGAGATARCVAFYVNTLTNATGLGRIVPTPTPTATFNSAATNPYFHVGVTPGLSAAMTSVAATEIINMG